jgi:hypothetical protein
VKIWQEADNSLSGSTTATIACASSNTQHPNNTTCYPSSTIPSFLLENLGDARKMKGEKAN